MLIAIPSRARADQKNHTYDNLPPELQRRAVFFVPSEDVAAYRYRFPNTVVGIRIVNGIGPTRQFIIEYAKGGKVCMLDDDLSFFERRRDEPTKLAKASPFSISRLFISVESALRKHAHVGVAAREGANRNTAPYVYDTRMLRVLAYDTAVLKREKIRYDRCPVMEDFDVTLQLLEKGYSNIVLNHWAQDQGTSNAPGGCSVYRTREVQTEGARMLKKLHPDFVTVVTKETKGAWGGGIRTDVRIAWKKARESYNANR